MKFCVSFNESSTRMEARISRSPVLLSAPFSSLQVVTEYEDADPYTGSYEVTPKVGEQILPTAGKMMAQDMTVKAIPIYDVSNNSGGRTVYIAKEV